MTDITVYLAPNFELQCLQALNDATTHRHTHACMHAQIYTQLNSDLNANIALQVHHLFESFRGIPGDLITSTNNKRETNMHQLTYSCNDYIGCRESYISELKSIPGGHMVYRKLCKLDKGEADQPPCWAVKWILNHKCWKEAVPFESSYMNHKGRRER